jgi:peptide-methionine (S)-S-oxide reductase
MLKLPILLITLGVALATAIPPSVSLAQKGKRTADTFKQLQAEVTDVDAAKEKEKEKVDAGWETATFGNGCFWCTEAVFEELRGVRGVRSGYSGGRVPNPTYQQVGMGLTGHAEVIQMDFDPNVISYAKLLEVFWRTHDPTTLNQQGPDIGTQYRSVIFYHNDQQKELATKFKTKLNEAKAFGKPVVTEISEFDKFYLAENYHQDFYQLNRNNPYCRAYIPKKLRLLRLVFRDEIKASENAPKK